MHGIDGMGMGMGFGWIIGLGLLFLLVWLITRVITTSSPPPSNKSHSALDILNERYARGEISKTEYTEKKQDLTQ